MSNSAAAWRSGGILGVVILCSACMVYYHLVLFVPRVSQVRTAEGFGNGYSFGADFYPVWLTARESLLHHRDPYSSPNHTSGSTRSLRPHGGCEGLRRPTSLLDIRLSRYCRHFALADWTAAIFPGSYRIWIISRHPDCVRRCALDPSYSSSRATFKYCFIADPHAVQLCRTRRVVRGTNGIAGWISSGCLARGTRPAKIIFLRNTVGTGAH